MPTNSVPPPAGPPCMWRKEKDSIECHVFSITVHGMRTLRMYNPGIVEYRVLQYPHYETFLFFVLITVS